MMVNYIESGMEDTSSSNMASNRVVVGVPKPVPTRGALTVMSLHSLYRDEQEILTKKG